MAKYCAMAGSKASGFSRPVARSGPRLLVYHIHEDRQRVLPNSIDGMQGSYLGPRFEQADAENRLAAMGARFSTLPRDEMLDTTAKALANGDAVGWFQDRMEFGPRALGTRSILGDPRSPTMQKTPQSQGDPSPPRCFAKRRRIGSIWKWIARTCCWSPLSRRSICGA